MRKTFIILLMVVLVGCQSQDDRVILNLDEYNNIIHEIEDLEKKVDDLNNQRILYYTQEEVQEELSELEGQLLSKQEEYNQLITTTTNCVEYFDETIRDSNGKYTSNMLGVYQHKDGLIFLYPNGRCLYGTYENDILKLITYNYEITDDVLIIGSSFSYKLSELIKTY